MEAISIKKLRLILLFSLLLIAGCKVSQPSINQPTANQQIKSGFTVSDEGFKWNEDKNALPFEEAIKKAPFQIKEPPVPFEVTNKVAYVLKSTTKPSFDIVVMTFANADQGYQLTVGADNSKKPTSNPKAPLGPKLKNGDETWTYIDQGKSGLYWRHNGQNYSIISFKIENGKFVPLYDTSSLIEIANTIN